MKLTAEERERRKWRNRPWVWSGVGISNAQRAVSKLHAICRAGEGCIPMKHTKRCSGRPYDDRLVCRCGAMVMRMVRIQQKKGNQVEDYRDLAVCVNCGVPINHQLWKA